LPIGRYCHSSCVLRDENNEYIVVFGGESDYKTHNDVWLFDVGRKKWQLMEINGEQPSERLSCVSNLFVLLLL
jgi:hypothetical protein